MAAPATARAPKPTGQKADEVEMLVATDGFLTSVGGVRRTVRKGSIIAASDPIVKGRAHFFVKATEGASRRARRRR